MYSHTKLGVTREWTIVVIVGLIAVVYFYRGFFLSGFELVQGNFFDGRLTLTISQHWSNPWQFGSYLDTGIFYPFGRGLMYSDTFLGSGILAAPMIWLGLDPSISFQIVLILMSFTGYLSVVAVLRLLRSTWLVAIVAGLLATFSNGMLIASAHPQLIFLSLFPVVVLLLMLALRSASKGVQTTLGLLGGSLFGVILYSAFYVGWLLIFAGFLTSALTLVVLPGAARQHLFERIHWRHVIAPIFGFIPFAALTVATYLPLLQAGNVRNFDDVAVFGLAPKDLLGVSPANLVWSQPLARVFGTLRDEEFAMSPTPLVLLAGAVMLAWGLRYRKSIGVYGSIGIGSTLTGFIMWVLPVRWGAFFPWSAIYELPGAAAIRAIGRIEIVAGFFMVFGLALLTTALLARHPGPRPYRVVAVAVILLLVGQINVRVQQKVDVTELAALRALPAPEIVCSSFFIAPPLDTRRIYDNQADPVIDAGITAGITAGIVARAQDIPSVNGYSGGEPIDWTLGPATLIDPAIYESELARYVERYSLDDVCALSLADGSWSRYIPATD